MNASEIISKAPGAAIAVNSSEHIVRLNQAAMDLLGRDDRALVGRQIQELMRVWDIAGNSLGPGEYTLHDLVGQAGPAGTMELAVLTGAGETEPVMASVLVVAQAGGDDHELVIQLQPKLRRRRADRLIDRMVAASRAGGVKPEEQRGSDVSHQKLTPRQLEVLRLLARGSRPAEAAATLGIRPATMRSHIRQLFRRLEARNQLEAVAVAFRERLL